MNNSSMLPPRFLEEMRHVLSVQRRLTSQASTRLDDLTQRVERLETSIEQFREERNAALLSLEYLEQHLHLLQPSDLDSVGLDEQEVKRLAEHHVIRCQQAETALRFTDWESFVATSIAMCSKDNADALLPWEAMLSDEDLQLLKREETHRSHAWTRTDYVFVGLAGVLAALSDYLLVRIPKTISYGGVLQAGSPLTAFLKDTINSSSDASTWFTRFAKELEAICKVPYDAVTNGGLGGLTGKTHRLQTLGHDPLLGLVFGVLDILRGTITGFSYDKLTHLHTLRSIPLGQEQSVSLIHAFLLQLGHLVSDVGTPMGLQPPFFTLFQGLNVASPFSPKHRTIGEIARWMYLNGYDFRHFLTTGVTPAVVELVLRSYMYLSHYAEHGESPLRRDSYPKYRTMLLCAHGIACAANAGKVALLHGNPLAINYAEWVALIRYLVPSLKCLVFGEQTLAPDQLGSIEETVWDDLLSASMAMEETYYAETMPLMIVGEGHTGAYQIW